MNPKELQDYRKTFPDKQEVMEKTPDPGVRTMLRHMAIQGVETVFDRFDAQKPQCGFGITGVCCRVCNMGPCKITDKTPRGVCGADAHVVTARNILRWTAAGVASHGARGREVVLALKRAAEGKAPLPIRGPEKVKAVAKALGLQAEGKTVEQLAGEIADILLEDINRIIPGKHRVLHAMAPPERIARWGELDILPIGSYHEVFEAFHRTTVGNDGDWENLMKQLLRCGLAFSFSSVAGTSIAMDCLYGLPKRTRITANFGAIEPEYVNIAIHGHSPVLPSAIVQAADDPELARLVRQAGAKGIRFYGICCSGLSTLYRYGEVHPLSNAMGAELVMATGALDLWVADVQDVFPGIMEVAKCFHTRVVTTSDSCRLPEATHIAFDHDHSNLDQVHDLARRIVRLAIDNYPRRVAENVFVPRTSVDAEVGFSVENITETFGGLGNLLEHLKAGNIKGIINLVGCNNPKVLYEGAVTQVTDILLANDYLVLTNGCASFPLIKLGYCTPEALAKAGPGLNKALGEKKLPPVWHMGECMDNARASGLFRALADGAGKALKEMPFAFSSPEWSNEKGVGAALSFRLLGLNSYHCVPAPVMGSDKVSRFFAEDTKELLGSAMVVNTDPEQLGRRIVKDLLDRREALGWQ